MTDEKIKEILLVELKKAENIWKDVKDEILLEERKVAGHFSEKKIPTPFPGFLSIKEGEGKVGNFIAMVLDTRDSTKHLLEAIKNKKGVSQLQRVLYENTAINTIGLILVNENKGRISEFLGDGFLAIFSAEEKRDVYKPKKAAEEFIRLLDQIINPILAERYDLPPLKVGIGLAYSKAIVTVVGFKKDVFPKVIGECVYRASKLSNGENIILYDEYLKNFWPSSRNGNLRFALKTHKNSNAAVGYTTTR